MSKYFGTNGIRGKLPQMSPDFAMKLGLSFGTWVKNRGHKEVYIGRDTRVTGEMIESAFISGLLWAGCKPIILGIIPSPGVEFISALEKKPHVIITCSHNPPEWIGLKFGDEEGIPLSKERGEEIEHIYENEKWEKVNWNEISSILYNEHRINEYYDLLKKSGSDLSGLKLVIDCGNGAACRISPRLFEELGAEVIPLNSEEDGLFPGRNSEPIEPNLTELISKVKEHNADIGIAYDGDCDRLALVDEKGNFVDGNKVFAIGVKIAMQEKEGDVVTTIATSNLIKEIVEKEGRKLKYVVVGTPYICEEMHKGGYSTGGEEVGGIIWPLIHPGKDGILSSIKIISYLKKNNLKLSEMVSELPKYYVVKSKMDMGEERFELVEKMKEKFKDEPNANIIDGLRMDFEKGWCILRPSGTENYLRIFAESKEENEAKRLIEWMKEKIN
jgi:phosphomannomutase / phosphoglucomutase